MGIKRRVLNNGFLFAVCLCCTNILCAGSLPLPLSVLPTTNGTVYAQYVKDNILYLAGDFDKVDGKDHVGLAAIDITTGLVIPSWKPDLDIGKKALILIPSYDGKILYVGGDFSTVGGLSHALLATVEIYTEAKPDGEVLDWDAAMSGSSVNALTLSADGRLLYIGGQFSQAGAASRANLAAIDVDTEQVTPWEPQPNDSVHSLELLTGTGRLYVGGKFTEIGSVMDGRGLRTAMAVLNLSNAAVLDWDATISEGVDAEIFAIELSAEGDYLSIAGRFAMAGGLARSNVARLDSDSALAESGWKADTNGVVYAMAIDPSGHLLIAGDYTEINGMTAYRHLAMLETLDGSPLAWNPQIDSGNAGDIHALVVASKTGILYVGGNFSNIDNNGYNNIAAFDLAPPVTVSNYPGGKASQLGLTGAEAVTLTCTDHSGNSPCDKTYVTINGSDPDITMMAYDTSIAINISVTTILKFFSVDVDGNREAVRTEIFTIEMDAPKTTITPELSILNGVTNRPVELLCDDGVDGSGCFRTYYTLDGSLPTPDSAVYDASAPVPLLNGITVLRYYSVDKAGNSEAVQLAQFTVDEDLPQISVSHENGLYTPPLVVTLRCDDGVGSGCDLLYITTDGSVPETHAVALNYTQPIELSLTTATVLRVFARDFAGNSGGAIIGVYTFTAAEALSRSSSGTGSVLWLPLLLLLYRVSRRYIRLVRTSLHNS